MKNVACRGGPDLSSGVGEPGGSQDPITLTKGEVTTADAEADFLSGGDPRALRCEPDEQAIVGLPPDPVRTLLLTPTGPVCC